jgi:L-lactate dehydrogenase complex protein LldF
VKVNLHEQILRWRQDLVARGRLPVAKRLMMWGIGGVMTHPWLYDRGGWLLRKTLNRIPRPLTTNRLNPWTLGREMPRFPKHSFKELAKNRKRTENE